MGRPPSNYSPGRPSNASLTRRCQQYVVPPTPEAVAQAIRAAVRPSQYQTRIRNLTIKLQDQQVKQEKYRSKIQNMERQKDEQLRIIRETHREETQQNHAAIETTLRTRYDEEAAQRRKKFDESLETEMTRRRAEFRAANQYQHEPVRKRLQVLRDAANGAEPDGAIVAMYQPALESIEIKSDGLKVAYEEAEAHLEQLNESRADMIWLLKQAIQMEAKAKLKKMKEAASKASA